MANQTLFDTSLPPLPTYTLSPQKDLVSWFPDLWMSLMLPIIVYWAESLFFHAIDVLDLFPQYRLHTPEEISKRNHATRYEVARDVIVQQVLQVGVGAVLALTEPLEMAGKQEYDLAVWATRLRLAQRYLPSALSLVGLNAMGLSEKVSLNYPVLGGALAGGFYPFLSDPDTAAPAFASWELAVAKFIYYLIIPSVRIFVGVAFLDSWQYWIHRLMHVNRWMYTHWHSRHHRLYVPYAFGALYNHPVEGFFLDTVGTAIAFKVAGLTIRQGTFFFCFCTIKTVNDHCGYSFPFDPLQRMTKNNAAYHDIHHQHWGIKTNFSQPFFTFWDGLLGTEYKGPKADRLADKQRRLQKAS